jgi:sugar/nucleoside kinase (ribokinase family)
MKAKRVDCFVAGEANVDLMVQTTVSLEPGKEKLAENVQLTLGGSSSITAFNLARLGAKVSFIGVVGTDAFGRFVEERLTAAGVDLNLLRRSETEKTGITIWLDQSGKRSGVTYLGTIPLLTSSDIPLEALSRARHLHVGHYFLLKKLHRDAPAVFAKAKRLGLTTSLDCNYDPTEKWDSQIRKVLPYVDVFLPNEQEALLLTGLRRAEDAAKALGKLARTVAVKLGARGVLVFSEGEVFRIPAKKVRVVDTTGAGDSFNAGFLVRFLQGKSIRESARSGIAAAARCVRHVGGTTAFEPRS